MNTFRVMIAAAFLLASGTALAQDRDNTEGLYIGGGYGSFSATIDNLDDVADAGVIFYDLEVTTPNFSDRIDQSDNDLVLRWRWLHVRAPLQPAARVRGTRYQ